MKTLQDYEQDITSIRSIMERSVKFFSLSGISGILAGIYALIGASLAYYFMYYPAMPYGLEFQFAPAEPLIQNLIILAIAVLILSLGTGVLMSVRKANKLGAKFWNAASRELFINLLIPLASGGLFILILVQHGYYSLVAPSMLFFYGLALVHGSMYTFKEIRYLGFTEIILGLVSAWLPGYGLLFWATGFGLLHIIYGSMMHYRYER